MTPTPVKSGGGDNGSRKNGFNNVIEEWTRSCRSVQGHVREVCKRTCSDNFTFSLVYEEESFKRLSGYTKL